MSFLHNIKERVFNRSLQQLSKQNRIDRKFVGFEKAQYIGILFDATDLNQREIVFQYADQLGKKGTRIKLLGFFDSKLEDPNFTFKYFNRKNLDWAGRPTGEQVQEFVQQPFDMLINLDVTSKPQAAYVSAQSKAHLRVGPVEDHTFSYELMIDISGSNNLHTFIQQMEAILAKTNARQHEKTQV
ncbi:MAG: DUF6913 domain-containing protein [Saprospiraceae bacterium]